MESIFILNPSVESFLSQTGFSWFRLACFQSALLQQYETTF